MTDTSIPREVIFYCIDGRNREPFSEWLSSIRNPKARWCILRSIRKMEYGKSVDRQPLREGEGMHELRIFFGPGYRVYFGEHGNRIVILLGGDKDDQQSKIQRANDYWKEYKNREKRK